MPLRPHTGPGPCCRLHNTRHSLTSSSQYLRITSRALSVISGASRTTLVKILPDRGTGNGCREATSPQVCGWPRSEAAGPSGSQLAQARLQSLVGKRIAAKRGQLGDLGRDFTSVKLSFYPLSTGDSQLYSFVQQREGGIG